MPLNQYRTYEDHGVKTGYLSDGFLGIIVKSGRFLILLRSIQCRSSEWYMFGLGILNEID